jgi:hypothetical protein
MKKQTAMQQLKDKIQVVIGEMNGELNSYESGYKQCLINIQNDIDLQMLAMEKEQILEAYVAGAPFGSERALLCEEYYNETYGGDHIGDVNEMVNHVPDVGKMVEDVEKLAEKYPYGGREGSKRLAFIDGYNTAKETLYTEEQVREAMNCTVLSAKAKERVIQSLKQSKQ